MSLMRPVALRPNRNRPGTYISGRITQDFDGGFSWEPVGYLRSLTIKRGKKTWFPRSQRRRHLHLAIDYSCPVGTPVRAVRDGVIVAQGRYPVTGEYYLFLRIKRGLRFQVVAFYTHLKPGSFRYRVGARVPKGAILARSGNTGWSTGPHLHFELRRGLRFLRPSYVSAWLWTRFDPQPFINGTARLSQIT